MEEQEERRAQQEHQMAEAEEQAYLERMQEQEQGG